MMQFAALNIGLPKGRAIPSEVKHLMTPPANPDVLEQQKRLLDAIDRFAAQPDMFPVHPVFGPLSRAGWTKFHLRHCELHLRHLSV